MKFNSKIFITFLCICFLSANFNFYLHAEGKINSQDILSYWEQNGYPDIVSSVNYIKNNPITILLTDNTEENQNKIKNSVNDPENIVFQTGKYSYNYMKNVKEEIITNYMQKDANIYSIGISSYIATGSISESEINGIESRVCITMSDEAYNLYHSELEHNYGDVVQLFKGEPPVFYHQAPPKYYKPILIFGIMLIVIVIVYVMIHFTLKIKQSKKQFNGG